jgi:cell division transport system permease protein
MKNIFSIVALSFFILLFAISLFIIYNTIKLAMVARKKEINIMKFVGATNSFIRWPFIIEGLIIGAIAAAIAYILQWYIYTYFVDQVFKGINIIKLVAFSDISGLLVALFFLTGMLVGVIGSVLAIRKYLTLHVEQYPHKQFKNDIHAIYVLLAAKDIKVRHLEMVQKIIA